MDPKRFLQHEGIRPIKKMGQNFLRDEYLAKEIALANLRESDIVLEIGPGYGNLTRFIADVASVEAVEIDTRFLPYLEKLDNVNLIMDDATKVIDNIEFNKVVSNIPYSQSQDILLKLLQKEWELAVLCVQEEFAEKMGTSDKLGMLLRSCCDVRRAFSVPADAFYPRAVDSAVVVIKQKNKMDEKFWAFLKKIYRKRNTNAEKLVKGTRFAGRKINSLDHGEVRRFFREYKRQNHKEK